MINYQNIKIFNKNGYEIPFLSTSNIIFSNVNNLADLTDDNIVLYGYYDGENKNEFSVKIINPGRFTKSEVEEIISNELLLYSFVDGYLVDKNATIKGLQLDNFKSLYYTIGGNTTLTLDSLIANEKDDEKCIYYSLDNLYINDSDNVYKISCDLSNINDLLFPSTIFLGNINIDKVSVGLVETETLIFGQIINDEYAQLFDNEQYEIKLIIDKNDKNFKFLSLDVISNEIEKLSEYSINVNSEQYVNVGFFPDQEGVYESDIFICLVDKNNNKTIKIGQLSLNAEAVGYDERYDALFNNFGVLNPKTYYSIFKEHYIDEVNPDWKMINEKSKELFLSYNEIFPYIGTYKALINAVDFLGYDDIYFREWYKIINDEKNKEISYRININDDFFDSVERNSLDIYHKKLNKLTMVYKLNQETGEFDDYYLPIVKNVYDYSITEILIKLIALKDWLERNIIAVNCRIIDITGEGVVYERLDYILYGTIMQNIEYESSLELSPYVKNKTIELLDGSANIEIGNLISSDKNCLDFSDFENISISEISNKNETIEYPFISDFIIKATIDTSNAIIEDNVTKPLWINNTELSFLKLKDILKSNIYTDESTQDNYLVYNKNTEYQPLEKLTTANFIETSEFITAPIIHLQRGYFRRDEIGWKDNIEYTVLPDITGEYSYMLINSNGDTEFSYDNIILYPTSNAKLKYTIDNAYNVPMFKISGYNFILYSSKSQKYLKPTNPDPNKFGIINEYILDIQDGKIINPITTLKLDENGKLDQRNGTIINDKRCIINFHYDDKSYTKQSVSAIYEYKTTHKYNANIIDTSNYTYDEFAKLYVNNIGHYNITVYAYNDNGNIFAKNIEGGCDVIINKADISIYSNKEIHKNSYPFHPFDSIGKLSNINLQYDRPEYYDISSPVFRNNYKISELSYGNYNDMQYIQYPSTSYENIHPENGDYIHLVNLVDKFICKTYDYIDYTCEFESTTNKQFNIFSKLLKSPGKNLVNIVVYNKLYNSGIYEITAEIKEQKQQNGRFTLVLKVLNTSDFLALENYIKTTLVDYNYEMYIQPITTFNIKSIELDGDNSKFSFDDIFDGNIENNINSNNNFDVFNEGDCIKVIYSINKYDDDNTYLKINDKTIVHDISSNIKYYQALDQYLDEENNQYLKLYKINKLNKKFSGYSTYRIIKNRPGSFTINDKFNYNVYNISYLLGEIKDEDAANVNPDLKTKFEDKYIVRYGDTKNIISRVILNNNETLYDSETDSTYSYNSITTDVKVAKAHQAYVKYVMKCEGSNEYFNSYTRLYTKKNRLYNYLDNSFSFIISKFDITNAFKYWNDNYVQPDNLYEHNNPITLYASSNYTNSDLYTGNKIVLASQFKEQQYNYTYWKVYKQNTSNNTRELLFEVMNNRLYLNFPYMGLYDIEAYNYDKYGNLSLTSREAYIYVK